MSEREKPLYLKLLPEDFYIQDSLIVAPSLIGCVMQTKKHGVVTSGRITETEAYPSYDAASHAFDGKRTPRTEIQFSKGGKLDIYQIMGLHLMTSVVVGEEGNADVVFIRSIEPLEGIEEMQKRRNYYGEDKRRLASGPGVLSIALGIARDDNGKLVYDPSSEVRFFKDTGYVGGVSTGSRINLGVHGKDEEKGKVAIERKWRFFEPNSAFLSSI